MHLPHLTEVATTATFSFGPSSCARIRVQCMRLLLQLIQPMCCCSSSYSAYACCTPRPHRLAGPLHKAASRPCPAGPARPVVAFADHVVLIVQLVHALAGAYGLHRSLYYFVVQKSLELSQKTTTNIPFPLTCPRPVHNQ